MKKVFTTYSNKGVYITVNGEVDDHISIHEGAESCSGILKHWGSKKELIKELEDIIKMIKELE